MSEGMSEKLKACPGDAGAHARLAAVANGGDVTDVYGSEWCLDAPGQALRKDLSAILSTRPAESALSVSREAVAKAAFKADVIERTRQRGASLPETFDFDASWQEWARMPLSGPGFLSRWYAIADAILALTTPESANVGEWMPIETAPHAVDVLLYLPPTIGEAGKIESGWASGGERVGPFSSMWKHGSATHWRPLPAPPALTAREGV